MHTVHVGSQARVEHPRLPYSHWEQYSAYFYSAPVEYHRPVCTLTNDLKRNYISNIDDCVLREHQIRNIECNIEKKNVRNVQKNRIGVNRVLPMFKSVRMYFGSPFR